MKVTRVLHVSVNTERALDETGDFYADVLGLSPIARPDIPGVAGRWLSIGDAQLHLVDAPEGADTIRPSAHHYCLAVEDLDGAIRELDARGTPYKRGAQGEVVQIWIADPSGNTIELQQDRAL